MKRKSENPAEVIDSKLAGSKKRPRLSEEESSAKRFKKDKKDKKGKKDKNSKRKNSESQAEAVEETNGDLSLNDAEAEDVAPTKKERSKKKSKKAKTESEEAIEAPDEAPVKKGELKEEEKVKAGPEGETNGDVPIKDADAEDAAPVKDEKNKNKSKKTKVKQEAVEAQPTGNAEVQDETVQTSAKDKKNRFIVFVGNLPFSATKNDIEKHFCAVRPTDIRLLTTTTHPKKSRGIAFLEFSGYDTMKTCLAKMHHTTMTITSKDNRGKAKTEERQINVELTAGGGGNTKNRKEKIKEKNKKLDEERARRAIEEEKAKVKKEQERLTKQGEKTPNADGIHPSRRARMVPGSS